jgi:hypothetical protein
LFGGHLTILILWWPRTVDVGCGLFAAPFGPGYPLQVLARPQMPSLLRAFRFYPWPDALTEIYWLKIVIFYRM